MLQSPQAFNNPQLAAALQHSQQALYSQQLQHERTSARTSAGASW